MTLDLPLIFKIESFLILSILFFGLKYRKQRKIHMILMQAGIYLDLFLVLQIELTRGAIKQAISPISNSMILNIHLLFSISTVFMYLFMLYSGYKLKRGQLSGKKLHIKIGFLTIAIRVLNFLTSIMIYTQSTIN